MQLIHLSQRLSRSYSPGWDHLDQWSPVGQIRVTPGRLVRQGNGFDDGGTYVRYARLRPGQDWRLVARAVGDTLSTGRCRHEYDCCGCASTDTTARLIRPRLLQIRTNVSYNY